MAKNNLRVIMAKQKVSQTELSRKTGIARSTIHRIYQEAGFPIIDTLLKIAKALNVTLDDIVPIDQQEDY